MTDTFTFPLVNCDRPEFKKYERLHFQKKLTPVRTTSSNTVVTKIPILVKFQASAFLRC